MQTSTIKSFYTVTEEAGILTAHVTKRISVTEFREMLIGMKGYGLKMNIDKLLLDGSTVDFSDVKMSERHDIGLATAEILKGHFKAALIIQKQYINKHGENVANNRGAEVLVTDNMETAIAWLLK